MKDGLILDTLIPNGEEIENCTSLLIKYKLGREEIGTVYFDEKFCLVESVKSSKENLDFILKTSVENIYPKGIKIKSYDNTCILECNELLFTKAKMFAKRFPMVQKINTKNTVYYGNYYNEKIITKVKQGNR